MRQETFLRNKINRQIKQNGSAYVFKRLGIDEYGQRTDEVENTFDVKGIFHEVINHLQKDQLAESDGARIVDIPSSYILCLFEDGDPIRIDDFVEINEKIYKVVNKINVGNYNVAYDISLGMIANGDKN